jgi:hypothetical protein
MGERDKFLLISEEEKVRIRRLFPGIARINDLDIQEKVVEMWGRMWRRSGLPSLEKTPADRDDIFTLVKHTNVTVELSLGMAQKLIDEYGVSINIDNLLAIAILHDADQIVLREKKGNRVQPTELERRIPHGVFGGFIALEVGLPPDIAHGIMFHRPGMEPVTIEGVILKYCDNANYYVYAMAAGWMSNK